MSNIRRRLKKAEDKLNLNQEHKIVNIVDFSGAEELPPDRTDGNITIHLVKYEDIIGDSTKGNKKQRNATNSEEAR